MSIYVYLYTYLYSINIFFLLLGDKLKIRFTQNLTQKKKKRITPIPIATVSIWQLLLKHGHASTFLLQLKISLLFL